MTTQIRSEFQYGGRLVELVTSAPHEPFDPQAHGLRPVWTSTACWRGWVARYALVGTELRLARLELGVPMDQPVPEVLGVPGRRKDPTWTTCHYELSRPLAFDGGVIIKAAGRMLELVFAGGQLTLRRDCTAALEAYFEALVDPLLTKDLLTIRRQFRAALAYPYMFYGLTEALGTDPASGAALRSTFVHRIETQLYSARLHSTPLTLVILTIDGARAADSVLAEICRVLESHRLGPRDIVAPHAADRVAITITPDQEGRAARVDRAFIESVAEQVGVRVSAGVAEFDPTVADADELLETAVRRARRAQQLGGNLVIDWG